MNLSTLLGFNLEHKLNKDSVPVDSKMNFDTLAQDATLTQNTTVRANPEADLSSHNDFSYASDIIHNSLLIIPLVGWCILIISLLAAFFKSEKAAHASTVEPTQHNISAQKYRQSALCTKCRYFSHNPYIRCAVHPSKALTAQAIDCSDYHSL